MDSSSDISSDDQFLILLHKKIMYKTGSGKRRMKKYYMDIYKETGVIPEALKLVREGIMEGRKCSGRKSTLTNDIIKRFIEIVQASCNKDDDRFIFITKKARVLSIYRKILEEEFQKQISENVLSNLVRNHHLDFYLEKPDFDYDEIENGYFNPEEIFFLIQMDGCKFHYLKIRDENNNWYKPQIIELYDTGSRNMLALDVYKSESSENAVALFCRFLKKTPLPQMVIKIRPDQAKGFLNLKRVIHELNLKYSLPDGFFMATDFAGIRKPKHKPQLESSHRKFHIFEITVIIENKDKIVKTEPGFIFSNNKREKITITYLDMTIEELRQSRIIETYRHEHNNKPHRFFECGKTKTWIPNQKLQEFLLKQETITIDPDYIESLMKYGFDKKKASVSREKSILFNKQKYIVVEGVKNLNSCKRVEVRVSLYNNKLYIFENKDDGICFGEALPQGPSKEPKSVRKKIEKQLKQNEVEQIAEFLKSQDMLVDMKKLISCFQNGLTFSIAKTIFAKNISRYDQLKKQIKDPKSVNFVRFNAFLIDFDRYY